VLLRKGVFNLFRRLESESENLLWLLLSVKNVHLVVCVVYLPPNNSSYSREDTWELVENETQLYKRMYPCRNFIFLGDFNAYTSEEDELQAGEPLVNEPGQNVCLENECEVSEIK
jgi:endonuclease/exonuclease/phosphatase family metal-dependent hydrolase